MSTTKCYAYTNEFDLDRFRNDCASGKNGIWGVQTCEPELTLRGVVLPSWKRFVFNYFGGSIAVTGYELYDQNVNGTINQIVETFQKYCKGDLILLGVLE